MFEIGHEFVRNKIKYCVIDIIDYNSKRYLLLSIEKKYEKLDFDFYEEIKLEDGCRIKKVVDETIRNSLFDLIKREE